MPKIFDTLTAYHLLNENDDKGLKYLAHTILGVPKDKIKKYDEVTPGTEEFFVYGMNDAIWTYQLFQRFSPEIETQGLHHLMYDIEMPFQYALVELAINGIKADPEEAQRMKYEVQHLYYKIENELLEMFGGKYEVGITKRSRQVWVEPSINFNSSKQVIPLLEALGFEIFEKSKKGGQSWAKAAKKRLAGQHPAIDLLIKLGKVEKLLNGFLTPFKEFIDEDGRIRCSFHNTVAVTGRLSCSGPNIEQLPKNNDICNIRSLFISANDNIFIVADYKGQELRILGEESQDSNLKKAFRDGVDLHTAVAEAMGISRDEAKTVNFGIPYGKEAFGFSKDWGVSIEEAEITINKYFAKYPSVRSRIERCRQQISRNGYVTNMSGRRRRFPDFKKKNKWGKARCYRQGFNFLIQSFAADMIKIAAFRVIQNKILKLVNLVHDELVLECPKYYLEEGIAFVRECMINAVHMSIALEVDITYGERYGECKK
ncbi:MAG: hypothetical protein IMZ70_05835 [Candidatus Atribacteria bacterium]|nr:hypothetical protein [Candidatus Atribacteria bacterium]